MRRAALVLLVASSMTLSSTALGAGEDEARAHFKRGVELYDEGDYKLALVELERAYEIVPSYKVLYNIGQVHYQLGEYARAHRALRRYLDEGGADVEPERRAEVEKDLATLATRIATVTIEVNVPDAEIVINDQPLGKAPAARTLVEAGSVRVQVSKPGYEPRTETMRLAGGDERVVRIELAKVQREVIVHSEGVPTPAVIGWIATGVIAAGAIGTGLAATNAQNKFETMRTSPISGSPEQARADLDRQGNVADGLALATDILIGTALVAGGVSLWLTLRGKPVPGTPASVMAW
jgi:tetratricopeptide (TPR) repeat protein